MEKNPHLWFQTNKRKRGFTQATISLLSIDAKDLKKFSESLGYQQSDLIISSGFDAPIK